MTYIKRNCCICGPKTLASPCIASEKPAELLSFENLKEQWSGFFKDTVRSFFSYQRCKQCALLFCPTFFSDAQLSSLYENMKDNTADVAYASLQKTQYGYFKTLAPYLPALNGDYFEMGPDIGLFTQNVARERVFNKFWLAEPNKAVWGQLKKNIGNQDHLLFSDLLVENPIPTNTLGAAVMIHVLDHLLDPLLVLDHMHSKMQQYGILLIVTHDESSWLSKLLKHRWPAYCLQHPQLYQPKSMRQLLNKANFEVLDIQKTYNHFPLGYLLNHLCWALGFKKKIFPDFNALQLPLKLGNMITIAKKKDK